jgi:hypothetical protein
MRRFGFQLGVVALLVAASSSCALAHTKGLTLSRFGLIDVSLQANVDYVTFSDPNKIDFDKIGDRQSKGFNLTSFDLSLTGETAEFPLKFAMFLTSSSFTSLGSSPRGSPTFRRRSASSE